MIGALLAAAVSAQAQQLYVPAAAHVSGLAGTRWRTDLEVKASGSGPATFTLEMLRERTENSAPPSESFTVAPGASIRLVDVVSQVFGVTGNGALRLTATGGAILATSRTYNDSPSGTYGQFIPALPAESASVADESYAILQLSATNAYRTNLGLVNATGLRTTVDVDLYRADGVQLGSTQVVLRAFEMRQLPGVFSSVTAQAVPAGFALVRSETEGARYFAYASLVDNLSGDAIFLPAQLDSSTGQETSSRLVVFEAFMRHGCPVCATAGPVVDLLADQMADQPVLFLEHDVDNPTGGRLDRWWAAWGVGGSVSLPLVMVDSGNQFQTGSLDFANVYRSMVEGAMDRPALAHLQVGRERVANTFRFNVQLTNLSSVTLDQSNRATLTAIVYEERRVADTNRFVRAATAQPVASLAPGATGSFTLEVALAAGVDWNKLHSVVIADYRPVGAGGAYDTLQAARQ